MDSGLSNRPGSYTLNEEDYEKKRLGMEIGSLIFLTVSLADPLDNQVGWSFMLRKCQRAGSL